MFSLVILLISSISAQEIVYYPSRVEFLRSQLQNDPSPIRSNYIHNETDTNHNFHGHKSKIDKRSSDPTFYGHPKTQEQMWDRAFNGPKTAFDQVPSLVNLLHMLAVKHLNECMSVILYDKFVENSEGLLLQQLMKIFPKPYIHGRISNNNDSMTNSKILKTVIHDQCVNYIVFCADVMRSADVLGLQANSKVVVVARSSQWRVHEFLYNKASRNFVNLLVIAQSFRDDDTLETPYILYTHSLFIDGLGSSKPEVLTSWSRGKLARPQVELFPQKMTKGYAGHRFSVVAADQPPFVFRKISLDHLGNRKISWEGIEYRLLNLLGHRNNFSIEIKEPTQYSLGSGDSVSRDIAAGHGDIGMAGIYVTSERLIALDMSHSHSQDCAAFISLTSTALPRYRAIMGPFHWNVWIALTFTYLFGIFPLAFSDKHTLRHLIHNSGEVENMFWYVFGTFTNCFTFVGKNSWSKTTKVTTRLLIGWYWIFTIIITACYTGSIIAFVTLPVYPSTVDTVKELLSGNYRVGTLDHGGWERWFANSSDKDTLKLLRHLELVPNVEAGLRNTTRAFFWSYAFLGSRYQLEYVVQTNFTLESAKRAVLHISNECFAPFGVSMAFPKESVYTEKLNMGILRMLQSGIVDKIESDVKWHMQRSSSGKLLQVSSGNSLQIASIDERGLSLSDTQGMFLLLGAGFLAAGAALFSEWLGGCKRMCRKLRNRAASIVSIASSDTTLSRILPTPQSRSDVTRDSICEAIEHSDDDGSKTGSNGRKGSSESKTLEYVINECKETFRIHIEEYQEPEMATVECVESDVVVHEELKNEDECSTEDVEKGHTRKLSYVDWDNEINELFSYVKTESDDETVSEVGKETAATEVLGVEDATNIQVTAASTDSEAMKVTDGKDMDAIKVIDIEDSEAIEIKHIVIDEKPTEVSEHDINEIFGEKITN